MIGMRIAAQKLRHIGRELWLPPGASRAEIDAAIEALAPGARQADLRRRLAGIPNFETGRLDTNDTRDGRRRA